MAKACRTRKGLLAGSVLLTAGAALAIFFWIGRQDRSLKRLQAVGGIIQRSDASPNASVVVISLSGPEVTDAVLEDCQGQGGLRRLLLSNSRITDAGLKWLANLTALEE